MLSIDSIVSTLIAAREAYYNGLPPLMSDVEYDVLEDELRSRVPSHPLLKDVGSKSKSSKWEKVTHGNPMGSLFKVNTEEEFRSWFADRKEALFQYGNTLPEADREAFAQRVQKASLIVSEKLDGISISLVYKDGELVQAVTRGDGVKGDNIYRNVLLMEGLKPQQPGFSGWQRGEIVLRKSVHESKFPEYRNPRNAAAGIARRESDGKPCENLTVMHYQALRKGGAPLPSKSIEFKMFDVRGCQIPFWECVDTADAILKTYTAYCDGQRAALDYDIDGLVIEFDDLEFMEILGEQDGRPKGAVAFKFPPVLKSTTLRAIRWQVGTTGRVTPVAEFDPVFLLGAEVSNANLHNIDNFESLGLYPGCTVLVTRRGDCIPHLEKVVK